MVKIVTVEALESTSQVESPRVETKVASKEELKVVLPVVETANPLLCLLVTLALNQPNNPLRDISLKLEPLRL